MGNQMKKLSDYFILTEVRNFNCSAKFVIRDQTKVDTDTRLPIGSIFVEKKTNLVWLLIDQDATDYMFILANDNISYRVIDPNKVLFGYTLRAIKINTSQFNYVFGFDKDTGITPINKFGFLSNVDVINHNGNFRYTTRPITSVIINAFNKASIRLLEATVKGFRPIYSDQALVTVVDTTVICKGDPVTYHFTFTDKTKNISIKESLSMEEAVTKYNLNLDSLGSFINKEVITIS